MNAESPRLISTASLLILCLHVLLSGNMQTKNKPRQTVKQPSKMFKTSLLGIIKSLALAPVLLLISFVMPKETQSALQDLWMDFQSDKLKDNKVRNHHVHVLMPRTVAGWLGLATLALFSGSILAGALALVAVMTIVLLFIALGALALMVVMTSWTIGLVFLGLVATSVFVGFCAVASAFGFVWMSATAKFTQGLYTVLMPKKKTTYLVSQNPTVTDSKRASDSQAFSQPPSKATGLTGVRAKDPYVNHHHDSREPQQQTPGTLNYTEKQAVETALQPENEQQNVLDISSAKDAGFTVLATGTAAFPTEHMLNDMSSVPPVSVAS